MCISLLNICVRKVAINPLKSNNKIQLKSDGVFYNDNDMKKY